AQALAGGVACLEVDVTQRRVRILPTVGLYERRLVQRPPALVEAEGIGHLLVEESRDILQELGQRARARLSELVQVPRLERQQVDELPLEVIEGLVRVVQLGEATWPWRPCLQVLQDTVLRIDLKL